MFLNIFLIFMLKDFETKGRRNTKTSREEGKRMQNLLIYLSKKNKKLNKIKIISIINTRVEKKKLLVLKFLNKILFISLARLKF